MGGTEELEMIVLEGVPVEIQTGGDLEEDLAYRNHRSARNTGEGSREKRQRTLPLAGL